MTKEEALQAMQNGEKVTHGYFASNEHICMQDGMIITIEGYEVSPEIFWRYRSSPIWNSGWSIVNAKTKKVLTNKLYHD